MCITAKVVSTKTKVSFFLHVRMHLQLAFHHILVSKPGDCLFVATTGFGHALAKHLSSLGATVIAGCLHGNGEGANALQALQSPRLHVVQMDVTNAEQVFKAKEFVTSKLNGKGETSLGITLFNQ